MSRRRSGNDTIIARGIARRAHWQQGGRCNEPMSLETTADRSRGICEPRTMTADHVRPVVYGGLTRPGNVVAACYQCNQERGAELTREWGGDVYVVGDDTPSSPFAVLKKVIT